jgi:hypothetical protein
MDSILEQSDQTVVRCYCCQEWVRMSAVEVVKTGVRADDELWCIGCIRDVDSYTLSLVQPQLRRGDDLEFDEGD